MSQHRPRSDFSNIIQSLDSGKAHENDFLALLYTLTSATDTAPKINNRKAQVPNGNTAKSVLFSFMFSLLIHFAFLDLFVNKNGLRETQKALSMNLICIERNSMLLLNRCFILCSYSLRHAHDLLQQFINKSKELVCRDSSILLVLQVLSTLALGKGEKGRQERVRTWACGAEGKG